MFRWPGRMIVEGGACDGTTFRPSKYIPEQKLDAVLALAKRKTVSQVCRGAGRVGNGVRPVADAALAGWACPGRRLPRLGSGSWRPGWPTLSRCWAG